MLKNDYFQKGGHDPAILAQIRDLEFEAQRMQAVQRPAPPPGKEHSLTDNGVCNFLLHAYCIHSCHHYLSSLIVKELNRLYSTQSINFYGLGRIYSILSPAFNPVPGVQSFLLGVFFNQTQIKFQSPYVRHQNQLPYALVN